ncbi:MAG TPA: hypothetical protein VIJ20_04740 [Solirubrobacteraceae bacterium]
MERHEHVVDPRPHQRYPGRQSDENLRIVCPNCAATLDTHCGRKNRIHAPRDCGLCGEPFTPRYQKQRYCSQLCGTKHDNRKREPKPETRKVPRPPYEQLMAEVRSTSYLAVGRKYGVSDTTVRKWIRWSESLSRSAP